MPQVVTSFQTKDSGHHFLFSLRYIATFVPSHKDALSWYTNKHIQDGCIFTFSPIVGLIRGKVGTSKGYESVG